MIVPFYNAEHTLPFCLKALAAQQLESYEVILVDNNSTDGSAAIAKAFAAGHAASVTCVLEEKQGPSYARNTGASLANGDILAFTDSDCIPDPDWLGHLSGEFGSEDIGAVAGRIVGFRPETIIDKFHAMYTLRTGTEQAVSKEFLLVRGGFPTANLSIRRMLFERIGGFDESMKIYSEDYDLCARIYEAGYGIQYTPKALVYHKHRNTLKGTWRQGFGFGTGHAVLLKKHFKKLFILDLPRYQIINRKLPVCAWIDLAGADKKILAMLMVGFLWKPLVVLPFLYIGYIGLSIYRRGVKEKMEISLAESPIYAMLLIVKSFSLTLGRLWGSSKNKTVCI